MSYVLPAPQQPSFPVFATTNRFPVRRIYCVGRNYAAHVREMGNDEREPSFFFTKPASALVESGNTIPYPPGTENLLFEAELVVAIGVETQGVTVSDSLEHIWGYATGNDLTRRDIQAAAKKWRALGTWLRDLIYPHLAAHCIRRHRSGIRTKVTFV